MIGGQLVETEGVKKWPALPRAPATEGEGHSVARLSAVEDEQHQTGMKAQKIQVWDVPWSPATTTGSAPACQHTG